jgi:type VI secretion system protein ImpA
MPSEPLLDVAELLHPIAADLPAGEPVPYDLRQELEEDRREEDPEEFAPDDPMRPLQPKRADWSGIVRKTQEILTRSSKDLLVAARLTEAITKQHGFAGCRDGLRLLNQLVAECWDRVNPVIEDGDVEVRATPFTWLDESDRGARFPTTLRQVPLVLGADRQYCCMDWLSLKEGRTTAPPREDFDKAALQMSAQACQDFNDVLTECLLELHNLAQQLNDRMGSYAPGLTGIGMALEQCRAITKELLNKKGGPPAPGTAPEPGNGVAPTPGGFQAAGPVGSRAEAYRQLQQAATVLQQLEPHSPIPYLVLKAVELGHLPFPELMRRLIRNGDVLTELNRELGIKEPPSE